MFIYIYTRIYMFAYIYIQGDETSNALDQRPWWESSKKKMGSLGHEGLAHKGLAHKGPVKPIMARPMCAQGGPQGPDP